jgi:hypothetical protein
MRSAGPVARMGKKRGANRILVGRSDGRRPLGAPKRRWEDSIKVDLRNVGGACTGLSWLRIGCRWRALVNAVWDSGFRCTFFTL